MSSFHTTHHNNRFHVIDSDHDTDNENDNDNQHEKQINTNNQRNERNNDSLAQKLAKYIQAKRSINNNHNAHNNNNNSSNSSGNLNAKQIDSFIIALKQTLSQQIISKSSTVQINPHQTSHDHTDAHQDTKLLESIFSFDSNRSFESFISFNPCISSSCYIALTNEELIPSRNTINHLIVNGLSYRASNSFLSGSLFINNNKVEQSKQKSSTSTSVDAQPQLIYGAPIFK
jgi:hypothetical protein